MGYNRETDTYFVAVSGDVVRSGLTAWSAPVEFKFDLGDNHDVNLVVRAHVCQGVTEDLRASVERAQ
jgi:hypothetical protein